MRRPTSTLAATSLLFLLLTASVRAQQKPTLDQAEAQLKAGQLQQARGTLERWKKEHAALSAASDDAIRATYLGARLATKGSDAEDLYLSIAISAPAANPYVPESLLRVGQAELQSGRAGNAIPYFKRLISNYPKSEFAPTASEWLERAQHDSPRNNDSASRITIQVAAFRDKAGARSVRHQLEKAGFANVRVVTVPENSLLRVRVGRFKDANAAGDVLSRLKRAGYQGVIADATRETVVNE